MEDMKKELYEEYLNLLLVYAFFKFTPNLSNYNIQQGSEGTTRELGKDNEIIQNIRQGNLSYIDENVIEQMKQDVLRDIKQELKQNIRTKAMTSLVRNNNVEDDNSDSRNDNTVIDKIIF
ncbi:hypothetical protein RhiirC2_774975 [Rhizophagus irregularis]|uniref:Uncharacterized protein n=1 Tax=Rhizophagus irregularis TaxID=588596 RepID=A0A2N1NK46_9GLOM|nr:hypothetical protein RhiirC2_774975 [Rhizophagus irregularis]